MPVCITKISYLSEYKWVPDYGRILGKRKAPFSVKAHPHFWSYLLCSIDSIEK